MINSERLCMMIMVAIFGYAIGAMIHYLIEANKFLIIYGYRKASRIDKKSMHKDGNIIHYRFKKHEPISDVTT